MLKNRKSCFISVTLKSWSGQKLLDPTLYITMELERGSYYTVEDTILG